MENHAHQVRNQILKKFIIIQYNFNNKTIQPINLIEQKKDAEEYILKIEMKQVLKIEKKIRPKT